MVARCANPVRHILKIRPAFEAALRDVRGAQGSDARRVASLLNAASEQREHLQAMGLWAFLGI